ncbi:MAG: hypothetical protein EPO35_10915 [Acidobacteria bacterium]|nr:MAG: hypothetical protein EPO35_10915 [Acidobacteriota bacterium]
MSRLRRLLVSGGVIAALLLPVAACDNGPSTTDDTTSPTTPTTSPVTESFSTQLFVGGSASRSFTAVKAGTATVTLVSAGTATTKVGFGLGVPDVLGSGCVFTRSSEAATAGTSFTLPVDAGTYCVRVYDVGALTSTITFSVTIIRP